MSERFLPKIYIQQDSISEHPWVYGLHLDKEKSDKVKNGSPAVLYSKSNQYLGFGFVNFHARVGFRVIGRNRILVMDEFKEDIRRKIHNAVNMRKRLNILKLTNALRLVYSEGDYLSGLIVDAYADSLAIQYNSSGMYYLHEWILNCLKDVWDFKNVYAFSEPHVQKQESFDFISQSESFIEKKLVQEHGIHYGVQFGIKHKSGFYADQRTSRFNMADVAEGERVLDLCAFSGGFSLNAILRGKAKEAVCVELDGDAIAVLKHNFELNEVTSNIVEGDAVEFAKQNAKDFDCIVFDPPKMLRDAREKQKALGRYTFMNEAIIRSMKPSSILVTCSCSGLISKHEFEMSLRKAANKAGKKLQIFDWTFQASDHPYSLAAPEGAYLKVAWCYIQ